MLARWWRVVWRVVVLETTWEMDGGEDGIQLARGTTFRLRRESQHRGQGREAKHSTADGGVTAAAAAQAPKTKTDCAVASKPSTKPPVCGLSVWQQGISYPRISYTVRPHVVDADSSRAQQ